jgi:hypothetical protein
MNALKHLLYAGLIMAAALATAALLDSRNEPIRQDGPDSTTLTPYGYGEK